MSDGWEFARLVPPASDGLAGSGVEVIERSRASDLGDVVRNPNALSDRHSTHPRYAAGTSHGRTYPQCRKQLRSAFAMVGDKGRHIAGQLRPNGVERDWDRATVGAMTLQMLQEGGRLMDRDSRGRGRTERGDGLLQAHAAVVVLSPGTVRSTRSLGGAGTAPPSVRALPVPIGGSGDGHRAPRRCRSTALSPRPR